EKPAEKADRPSETASIPPAAPADTGKHRPTREKASKATPAPAPAAEPVVAAPVSAPAEPTVTPDANVLAREAIERLRGSEPAPRTQAKAVEPKVLEPKPTEPAPVLAAPVVPAPAPVAVAPSLQPLPPPIMVSTPPFDS